MTGTVTVIVSRSVFHPIYKKRYRTSKKFLADSGTHELYKGDEVEITECRPLSKRKHFMVTEIIKKAHQVSEIKKEEVEKTMSPERSAVSEDFSQSSSDEFKTKNDFDSSSVET